MGFILVKRKGPLWVYTSIEIRCFLCYPSAEKGSFLCLY